MLENRSGKLPLVVVGELWSQLQIVVYVEIASFTDVEEDARELLLFRRKIDQKLANDLF